VNNLNNQSNLVFSDSWPCFTREFRLQTFWGPFQPELFCDFV